MDFPSVPPPPPPGRPIIIFVLFFVAVGTRCGGDGGSFVSRELGGWQEGVGEFVGFVLCICGCDTRLNPVICLFYFVEKWVCVFFFVSQ